MFISMVVGLLMYGIIGRIKNIKKQSNSDYGE